MATILLVDDDDGVRHLLEETLSEAGFEVMAARDTIMARRQLELNPSVDLCLVDIVMPDGTPDGAAFAETVKRDMPDLPVILMTGYYTAGARAERVADSLIYKPIDRDALLKEVERRLPA